MGRKRVRWQVVACCLGRWVMYDLRVGNRQRLARQLPIKGEPGWLNDIANIKGMIHLESQEEIKEQARISCLLLYKYIKSMNGAE